MTEWFETTETTEEAIMAATYRALRAHGYAGTTISRIGEEFEKSQSLLYYHYDDKDDLLADFLSYLLDRLEADLRATTVTEPRERLEALLDKLAPVDPDVERRQFFQALLEMRAQTPHQPVYREQFERSDALIVDDITATIEAGIEEGVFETVAAEQTAEYIYSTLYGALDRCVTLGQWDSLAQTRRELDRYIETRLLTVEASE
ncbi:TetR family transcriptional regulator protein [Halorhabdus tiamatea SARL4B]|uniref:TetR family transcriptional regulator protein n=1 Tax=Halorhabdus tiamatea SARL4B TaxID=1033806 RepID=F7PPJ1_9EURY|nr:TetR/AcrR family transcriptional regulator [Halorhabdus tiamatea]ERJ04665.1 TetR family transcriptional regulator protein [Halorhabdus tiamatea SARL4B]CCQ34690.1 transcriptional regulator, TetR family [Halorhabdus tiamatea SARL4B]